jgi:hypothetical protein
MSLCLSTDALMSPTKGLFYTIWFGRGDIKGMAQAIVCIDHVIKEGSHLTDAKSRACLDRLVGVHEFILFLAECPLRERQTVVDMWNLCMGPLDQALKVDMAELPEPLEC